MVSNLGSAAVSNIVVSDPMTGTAFGPGMISTAGESMACTTANRPITGADAVPGAVDNAAVAARSGVTVAVGSNQFAG
ncbi:hypothetical protein SAMN04515671_1694 [Nakamurella panacisegetis]|uniref:Uncharacterized protein n=1 Tax=Nakamurella panacisegetis TaxID=1090615 RepID=A0A1H0LJX6_9ACTN|nr:hypothetical protein [Nakamurella panacisegetis]SDO68474.1 hypothetical protein SAMN04515671_1694 [Nakamurella panacisegetis]